MNVALLKAWEKHSGFDYGDISHLDFKEFKAGFDACHKLLCKCWALLPDMEHPDIIEIKEAVPYNTPLNGDAESVEGPNVCSICGTNGCTSSHK